MSRQLLCWIPICCGDRPHLPDGLPALLALRAPRELLALPALRAPPGADPIVERLYVGRKKGLVKIALLTGTPLVPCYCFGQQHPPPPHTEQGRAGSGRRHAF